MLAVKHCEGLETWTANVIGGDTLHSRPPSQLRSPVPPPLYFLACSVGPGAARVNLLYVTDCLLSHAKRDDAPAVARGLPAKAGAGLARMLQLAATDASSLERSRRALEALSRKGLLEQGYLRLGAERLEQLARGLEASAVRGGGSACRGGGQGAHAA